MIDYIYIFYNSIYIYAMFIHFLWILHDSTRLFIHQRTNMWIWSGEMWIPGSQNGEIHREKWTKYWKDMRRLSYDDIAMKCLEDWQSITILHWNATFYTGPLMVYMVRNKCGVDGSKKQMRIRPTTTLDMNSLFQITLDQRGRTIPANSIGLADSTVLWTACQFSTHSTSQFQAQKEYTRKKKKSILESLFQVAPTLRKSPSHHGPIHQDRRIGPKGGFDLLHPSQPRLELRRHGAAAAGITPGEHPTARDPNGEGGFLVWDPGWG